jgi:histidyl-tRNA synthetase
MGDVVLGELLKDRGLRPDAPAAVQCLVAAVTDDDLPHVIALVHRLRDAGLAAEHALGTPVPGLGKQLKAADARGARLAVVVGPDDRARGEAQLKDLAAKTQQAVPLDDLVARCRAILTSPD